MVTRTNQEKRKIREVRDIDRPTTYDPEKMRKAIKEVYQLRTCEVSYTPKGWSVIHLCKPKNRKIFSTQREAVEFARDYCNRNNIEIVIYTRDGRIKESRRHGVIPGMR